MGINRHSGINKIIDATLAFGQYFDLKLYFVMKLNFTVDCLVVFNNTLGNDR